MYKRNSQLSPMAACINEGLTLRCECNAGYSGQEHIAVISININLINVKTNRIVSIIQVALTVPVDVDIEQQRIQSISCVTNCMHSMY